MRTRPPSGKRLAGLPPGGARRRRAPAAAQMKRVCRARSRAWRGAAAPPPRAPAALQSRPQGSARPSSPRRRLRLRRARTRLTLPPRLRQLRRLRRLRQLRLGAGRSRSPDPEPGKRRRRARRAAAAAEAGGGGAAGAPGRAPWPLLPKPGRLASAGRQRRRRAPGARAARRVLRASRRELRPGRGGGRGAGLRPPGGRRLRAQAPAAPARATEPSRRPRRPAAGADVGAGGCAPGRGTRKVCPPPGCRAEGARGPSAPGGHRASPDRAPGQRSRPGWLGPGRCRLQSWREENFSSGEIRTAMHTAPPEPRGPERTPAAAPAAALGSRPAPGAQRRELR